LNERVFPSRRRGAAPARSSDAALSAFHDADIEKILAERSTVRVVDAGGPPGSAGGPPGGVGGPPAPQVAPRPRAAAERRRPRTAAASLVDGCGVRSTDGRERLRRGRQGP
jgi:hypothetical protein